MSWTYSTVFGWYARQEATPDGLRWFVRDPNDKPVAKALKLRRAMDWALQQRPKDWKPKGARDGA